MSRLKCKGPQRVSRRAEFNAVSFTFQAGAYLFVIFFQGVSQRVYYTGSFLSLLEIMQCLDAGQTLLIPHDFIFCHFPLVKCSTLNARQPQRIRTYPVQPSRVEELSVCPYRPCFLNRFVYLLKGRHKKCINRLLLLSLNRFYSKCTCSF